LLDGQVALTDNRAAYRLPHFDARGPAGLLGAPPHATRGGRDIFPHFSAL
jgi:hypothetical protein